jgi:hypothetical protein
MLGDAHPALAVRAAPVFMLSLAKQETAMTFKVLMGTSKNH